MVLREFIRDLVAKGADLDSEVIVSLDPEDKGYKRGSEMTPVVMEVLHDGPTTWLRTWKK